MNFKIEFHPEAILELTDSFQWYEERSEGLGVEFITSVNKRLQDIVAHPEKYAKKKGNYRETGIDVFPYIIIYEIFKKEQIIFVSYIFHTKRNPRLKYRR